MLSELSWDMRYGVLWESLMCEFQVLVQGTHRIVSAVIIQSVSECFLTFFFPKMLENKRETSNLTRLNGIPWTTTRNSRVSPTLSLPFIVVHGPGGVKFQDNALFSAVSGNFKKNFFFTLSSIINHAPYIQGCQIPQIKSSFMRTSTSHFLQFSRFPLGLPPKTVACWFEKLLL